MPDFSPWGSAAQSGMGAYSPPPQPSAAPGGIGMGGGGAMGMPAQQSPQQIANFWTPQQMAAAKPMPLGGTLNQGYSANTMPFQQNQGFGPGTIGRETPTSYAQGQAVAPGNSFMGGPMNASVGGVPMGSPGSGMGGPFGRPPGGGQGGMNPIMGFLLPFLMQRMGMQNRPGGVGSLPTGPNLQGGMAQGPNFGGSPAGGPMGGPSNFAGGMTQGPTSLGWRPGYVLNPGDSSYHPPGQGGPMPPPAQGPGPQRIMQGAPSPQMGLNPLTGPPMQTKSPFDMPSPGPQIAGPAAMGPAAAAFLPPSMGGQAQGPTGGGAAPQQIMQGAPGPGKVQGPAAGSAGGTGGGFTPPASPSIASIEQQMLQQQQQAQLNNSLSQMSAMNPTQNMMAQLLRQQLMGQLGY